MQKLLPGMTATVVFETGSADNALSVPNAALRLKPTDAMLAAAGQSTQTGQKAQNGQNAKPDSTRRTVGGGAPGQGGTGARTGGQQRAAGQGTTGGATLWTLGADGKTVKPVRVRTGLTDGQRTAITTNNSTIAEGTQVIIGVATDAAAAPATSTQSTNPFQPQRGGAAGRPRGL
jgi:HlyD family secretion protein